MNIIVLAIKPMEPDEPKFPVRVEFNWGAGDELGEQFGRHGGSLAQQRRRRQRLTLGGTRSGRSGGA